MNRSDDRYFFDESKAATRLTPNGREIPDSTPMEPPLGYKRSPSLAEQIRTMVRSEQLALAAEAAGAETFEEADDFDIGDDYDPQSPYENEFDPPISEVLAAGHAALKQRQEASARTSQSKPPDIAAAGPQSKPAEPLKAVPAKPEMKPVLDDD